MKVFVLITLSLLAAILASMTLAVYLPIVPVERMFVAGLSVPFLAPAFLLGLLFLTFRQAFIGLLSACGLFAALLFLGLS